MPIQNQPKECKTCILQQYHMSQGFSSPEGRGTLNITIVGDSLGRNEYIDGLPFRPHSRAGSKLEEVFGYCGVSRNQFNITTVLKCFPNESLLLSDGETKYHAAANCLRTHGYKDIFRTNARVILALGDFAFETLTGFSGDSKENQDLATMRGYTLPFSGMGANYPALPVFGDNPPIVVASYAPDYIMKGNSQYTETLIKDLKTAIAFATGKRNPREGNIYKKKVDYNIAPSLQDIQNFTRYVRDNPNLTLYVDCETRDVAGSSEEDRENIVKEMGGTLAVELVQFSTRKGQGIALPMCRDYAKYIAFLLNIPNRKVGHNLWNFDANHLLKFLIAQYGLEPKFYQNSVRVDDTMWMFKAHYPTLDRNLQSVASWVDFPFTWKHFFGSQLEWYGCADVDSCCWVDEWLQKEMKEAGTWYTYDRHIHDVYHLRLRPAWVEKGFPINPEKYVEVGEKLEKLAEKLEVELQEEIPNELKNISPKEGYKKTPKPLKDLADYYTRVLVPYAERENKLLVKFEDYAFKKLGLVQREFIDSDTGDIVIRWAKLVPFTPSDVQVKKYLKYRQQGEKYKKYQALWELPKKKKKKSDGTITRAETTGKDALNEVFEKTGDSVLAKILEIRSIKKTISNDLKWWKPTRIDSNGWGWVTPEPNFGPYQGQIAGRRPSPQVVSKHTEVGQTLREIIEAPEGWEFCEHDYKSFHIVVMGWLAEDPTYVRFGRLDPHSIYANFMFHAITESERQQMGIDITNIPLINLKEDSDERILGICKIIKKQYGEIRQKQCKPTTLGNQLDLGPKTLWEQNKKFIHSEREAAKMQFILKSMFPKVEKYKSQVKREVDVTKLAKLVTGRRLQLWNICQKYRNKWNTGWEIREQSWQTPDSRKLLAFMVQGTAFAHKTEAMLELAEKKLSGPYFNNDIHDALYHLYPVDYRKEIFKECQQVMEAPSKTLVNSLGGLQVDVEGSIGKNWKKFDKEANSIGMREYFGE